MQLRLQVILVAAISVFSSLCFASTQTELASKTPIAFSLVSPVQFPSSEFVVSGIRLSVLWGETRAVHGVDLGLIGNMSDQDFQGLAISGLFNMNYGTVTVVGLQFAGLANINHRAGDIYGLQVALANIGDLMNVNGIQLGLYNRGNVVNGVQIGIINVATNLHGLQIGLANFNRGGPFKVSPLINIGF